MRQIDPAFYGFVPPTGRGVVFFHMVIYSALQFLARITAIALLGAVSKMWVAAYLVGDLCLFLFFKLLQNDFFWWIPSQSYLGSIAFSLLMRVGIKVRVSYLRVEIFICALSISPDPNHTHPHETIDHLRLHCFVAISKPLRPRWLVFHLQPRHVTSLCCCVRFLVLFLP